MGGVRTVSAAAAFVLSMVAFGVEPRVAGQLADLRSPAVRVRARAAAQLAGARGEGVVPALILSMADVEPSVRRAAAKALGEQRDSQAVHALVNALGDEDRNVRFYAAHALGEIKDKAAAKGLLAALHDSAYGVRDEAAWALRELHDPSIAEGFYAELARADADVPHVSWLIRQLAGEKAVPELAKLLKNESATVRGRALRLLVELKTRAAVPALIEALGDAEQDLRRMAVEALASVRDERSIEPLKALVGREKDPTLRAMAKEVVHRLAMHPGIVACWSFDDSDGKTVANDVPIGGSGEIKGGAKLVPGKSGKGLECGEGKYVELGQPPMLPIGQRPLTFVAWIKPTAPTGVVIARGGAFAGFSLYLKDGIPKFGIHLEKDGPAYIAAAEKPVSMGEWTYLAGVVRQKAVEVWVNGELAGTIETPSYLLNNAGQGMEIGFDAQNSPCELTDAFVGVIDEVRMYHADLKAEDFQKQYERER